MIDSGTVTTSLSDGIATVAFAHPKGNSLPGALLAKLADAVKTAGDDPNVRVILLRSEGSGAFCAGASFDEFKAIADPAAGKTFFMGFATLILTMIRAPKFVVTRVHGKAVGGAIGLIAASDYAIASEQASLRLSELAVGIGPFIVGPAIQRKVGHGAFTTLAVDADWHDAQWGERHGLYASLQPTTEALDAAIDKLTQTLAASNPEAMKLLKANFWEGTEPWDALLSARAAMSGTLVLSDFTRRMLAARG